MHNTELRDAHTKQMSTRIVLILSHESNTNETLLHIATEHSIQCLNAMPNYYKRINRSHQNN